MLDVTHHVVSIYSPVRMHCVHCMHLTRPILAETGSCISEMNDFCSCIEWLVNVIVKHFSSNFFTTCTHTSYWLLKVLDLRNTDSGSLWFTLTVLSSINLMWNELCKRFSGECWNHCLTWHSLTSYLTVCILRYREQYFHQPTRINWDSVIDCYQNSWLTVFDSVLFASSCMFELPKMLPWRWLLMVLLPKACQMHCGIITMYHNQFTIAISSTTRLIIHNKDPNHL